MYTWIDMTFLRPRFATRDKFLIPKSGNKYKTLMYRIQSNGKQYIYLECLFRQNFHIRRSRTLH